MRKILLIVLVSCSLNAQVTMHTTSAFHVPSTCRNIAILGSTPHPTRFLSKNKILEDLSKIDLNDFLDLEYLRDSFEDTLDLCMNHGVDHLLIAYLPGHFVEQRASCSLARFEKSMNAFVKRVGHQVSKVFSAVAKKKKCTIPITLILPPRETLKTVPVAFNSDDHRIQHYIRSFPQLKGLSPTGDYTISIVNNRDSNQNAGIMSYLSYEYVLKAPLNFSVLELKKEKFHKYI
jgi:hypothetical protein